MIRSTLGVLAAGAGLSALVAAQGPPAVAPAPRESAPAKPVNTEDRRTPSPSADLSYLEAASANARREPKPRKVNGVTLEVRATVEHKFVGDVIVLEWSLDYDGPRTPLVILEPRLDWKTFPVTKVELLAVPEGRKAAWACPVHSVEPWGARLTDPLPDRPLGLLDFSPLPPPSPAEVARVKEMYLTVQPGKPATGKLRIPASLLRQGLADWEVDHLFDRKNPPRVFAKMWHAPKDRGEKYSLDAWTGELWSEILEVPVLESW